MLKAERRGNSMVIFPDESDREWFDDVYPDEFLKTSKTVRTKNFMDKFGCPEEKRYMVIRGRTKKSVKLYPENENPEQDLGDSK